MSLCTLELSTPLLLQPAQYTVRGLRHAHCNHQCLPLSKSWSAPLASPAHSHPHHSLGARARARARVASPLQSGDCASRSLCETERHDSSCSRPQTCSTNIRGTILEPLTSSQPPSPPLSSIIKTGTDCLSRMIGLASQCFYLSVYWYLDVQSLGQRIIWSTYHSRYAGKVLVADL